MIAYPLLLEPQYDGKIWGGRRLETVLGKTLPAVGPIGESLESGDAATITNGRLAGMTLLDVVSQDGSSLLGTRGLEASQPFHDFPILVKFIDASGVLSLQLHPDDDGARASGKRGKTEAWYIVAAEPGSSLITGMSRPAPIDEVRSSVQDGTFEALLERRTVRGGETMLVPAGTMHAIGAGVLLYEVQQNSDVTYRLYDWGRVGSDGSPRELHLEQALGSLRSERHAIPAEPLARDGWREVLAACRYFALERWQIDGTQPLLGTGGTTFRLISCIAGVVEVVIDDSTERVRRGQTVLLPADVPDTTLTGNATLLCSYIPDLRADVIQPLLENGHSAQQIAGLGGDCGDLSTMIDSAT